MAIIKNFVASSFALGIADNVFDAGDGDKSAAEALRDAYASSNPDWLSAYDANIKYNILLKYTDTEGVKYATYQLRAVDTWLDNTSAIGIRGATGSEGVNYEKLTAVNTLSDLPTPVDGVITLEERTTYMLGDDISLGDNRIVFSERSVIGGIESLNIELSYAGTGAMFTCYDVTTKIHDLTIDCPNGSLFDWEDVSGGNQLRFSDVQLTCSDIGTFTGVDSLIRFSQVSPAITTDGFTFSGTFRSFLYQVSGATLTGGTFYDLGTATFESFLSEELLLNLASGTTFLSGLADSGNIQEGGLGRIVYAQLSGGGTSLTGIKNTDALWEFHHNNIIGDTRPDALLYMQDNTVINTISSSCTTYKVNGTWTSSRASQFSFDSTGKATYIGGKNSTLPITAKLSLSPVSNRNDVMAAYIAVNGSVIYGSKVTALTDGDEDASMTVIWQHEFNPNDYVEIYIANDSDTTNLLVSRAVLRIN